MINTEYLLDLNPPYRIIDILNNLDEIIPITVNASIEDRQRQITQRYTILRENSDLFRLKYNDIYSRLVSDMEYASMVISLLNKVDGIEDSDQVKSLLRSVARKNNLPRGTDGACIVVITSHERLKLDVFMELLFFIEEHNLMNINSYRIVNQLASEYRQYKISRIIA